MWQGGDDHTYLFTLRFDCPLRLFLTSIRVRLGGWRVWRVNAGASSAVIFAALFRSNVPVPFIVVPLQVRHVRFVMTEHWIDFNCSRHVAIFGVFGCSKVIKEPANPESLIRDLKATCTVCAFLAEALICKAGTAIAPWYFECCPTRRALDGRCSGIRHLCYKERKPARRFLPIHFLSHSRHVSTVAVEINQSFLQ